MFIAGGRKFLWNVKPLSHAPRDRSGSVSYTHLDVYKRQTVSCIVATVLEVICFFLKPTNVWVYFGFFCAAFICLDVYKRQVLISRQQWLEMQMNQPDE